MYSALFSWLGDRIGYPGLTGRIQVFDGFIGAIQTFGRFTAELR